MFFFTQFGHLRSIDTHVHAYFAESKIFKKSQISRKQLPGIIFFDSYTTEMIYFVQYINFHSIGTHIPPSGAPFDDFHNFLDFQENGAIMGGKMVIFGGTSTQINYFGLMKLCAKNHTFSTSCTIFSPISSTKSSNDFLQRNQNKLNINICWEQ